MSELKFHYDVSGEDFTRAGDASGQVKSTMKQLGLDPQAIRKMAIALYEGEINMVIHGGGGEIDVTIGEDNVTAVLVDHGKGIPDIEQAMQEGYSTAPESVRNLGFGAGMGLPNMKKYSDELHIDSVVGQGTTVTIKINL